MQFKNSATIAVTGFVLFVIGGFINSLGIAGSIAYSLTPRSIYSSSSNDGAITMTLIGSVLALIGLIQMCMGAYRALRKIDALPVPVAALSTAPEAPAAPVNAPGYGASQAQPAPASPRQTPQHLMYNGSEQQPPVE
ncbi:hypothetical protein [Pseudarthrobacter phenanthrenivorans]|uniref:hypothetical protein n=1 Tax=Pseudarthrobacter phenanthrenivorans TaxID=361575 RepID=UPI0012E0BFDC|nr:hypothetical protein [Pseudarthrobacter phenanthrenivorans]